MYANNTADVEQITTIGAATLAMISLPKFRTPTWRPVRALMYVAMGLSAVIPVVHGIQIYGIKQLERQMGLSYVVSQGVLYITGAALYAVRQLDDVALQCETADEVAGSNTREVVPRTV